MTFDEHCYELLKQVPHGRVTTYKEIAKALGSKAYRAVGSAMARNPNLITTPCHRVVKSDGSVGHYAKGSAAKIALLTREGVLIEKDKIVDFEKLLFKY